jgi:endonuclease/exonuclease/phosphatase family metal-dependent hydrolase
MIAAVAAAETSSTLTLASYNIHVGVPMGSEIGQHHSTTDDLDAIAETIASLGAQVVALQEVDCEYGLALPARRRSSLLNQARYLAAAGQYNYVFGSAQDDTGYPTDNPDYVEWGSADRWSSNGQSHGEVGNALLTNLTIVGQPENIPLRKDAGQERRACIRTVLRLDSPPSGAAPRGKTRDVVIYTTHLQHNSGATRFKQMEAIIERIKAEPAGTVVFLIGDMNHEFSATEQDNPIRLARDSGLHDLGVPSDSDDPALLNTFPASDPTIRIDYIFANQPLTVVKKAVHQSQASDHLPLIVTVDLP